MRISLKLSFPTLNCNTISELLSVNCNVLLLINVRAALRLAFDIWFAVAVTGRCSLVV